MTDPSTPFTVSSLTYAIKNQLEARFSTLAVQGEISNLKHQSSGHLYFDLKDREAKISAVLFKQTRFPLSKPLKEGDQVTLHGTLSLYPPHGRYQIIVKRVELSGQGALLLALERLKKELKEKGWFDPESKLPLPPHPKKIGIVTSPTGAVIQDILHVLNRRLQGFHVLLNPVRVQGSTAPFEIAQAIEQFNTHHLVDVLIVGRGGGSLEDLWAFNELPVLKAIRASKIPIISAVGHETDVTLADFVADKRAPTPSAAAEIVSQESASMLQELQKAKRGLAFHVLSNLREKKGTFQGLKRHPLLSSPETLFAQHYQKIDELKLALKTHLKGCFVQKKMALLENKRLCSRLDPKEKLKLAQTKLLHLNERLTDHTKKDLIYKRQKTEGLREKLATLSPKNVLNRGYSILFSQKQGSIIMSAEQIQKGAKIKAVLAHGEKEFEVT